MVVRGSGGGDRGEASDEEVGGLCPAEVVRKLSVLLEGGPWYEIMRRSIHNATEEILKYSTTQRISYGG